ncbi:MAG: hypothetical protein H0U58_05935, partial [Chloroflexi bacterium]|nr:hypothetical protein [Chloroflexota bacterium]
AVDVERVQLPAGEAVHYRYALPAQGLPAPASIDQYMLVGGSNVFVVSITGGTEADAKAIAESVELLD